MKSIRKLLDERPAIRGLLLPALAVLFGIEMMRYFVSGMTWILGDRFDIGAFQLGGIAIVVFGTAFLANPLRHILGNRNGLLFTATGLGMMRLLAQIYYGEPIVNMVASALGIAFFGMFLTIYLDNARLGKRVSLSYLSIGLLLGFTFDTVLNGLFGTYDFIYQSDTAPLIFTIVLIFIEFLLLLGYTNGINEKPSNARTLPWLAVGFFFFLEMVVFGNIARLAVFTGWILPMTFSIVIIGQVLGLFFAIWYLSSERMSFNSVVLFSSLILIIATIFSDSDSNYIVVAMMLLGHLSIVLLLVSVINAIGENISGRVYRQSTTINGFAMIIFAIFVLLYYAVYQINLPYSNTTLEIVAAILFILCANIPIRFYASRSRLRVNIFMVPILSLVLFLTPMVSFITWHDVEAIDTNNNTLTIMTYNLHNGFNTEGELNLETLATVIEGTGADIVALQEISRGWLISGRVDMLSWLSQRLDMPYVTGPTAGPLWGNAILSKQAIKDYRNHELPPDNLCIERGFIVATIDTGKTELQIIVTHLHHVEEGTEIRQEQTPVILEYWDNAPNTIILGDFNALPDSLEMEMFYQAGLIDTLFDQPEALTYNSANLYERIDYIWLSQDIQLVESYVPFSKASDHLPVVATIYR